MDRKIYNQIKSGAFIAKKRNELNYTQEEVARRLGVTKTAVSNWENGISMVDVKYLVPLSNIFSIKVDDILFPLEILEEKMFSQTPELFKNMIQGKIVDKKICNKLMVMYIESKNNIIRLWEDYLRTSNEKILDQIVELNKFGFAHSLNLRLTFSKDLLKEYKAILPDMIKDSEEDGYQYDHRDYIETSWVKEKIDLKQVEKDSALYVFCKAILPTDEEAINIKNNSSIIEYSNLVIFMLNFVYSNCSEKIFQDYIKSFSQTFKNDLLTAIFEANCENMNKTTKNILRQMLRAKCKYIKENGTDETTSVWEKIDNN